MRILCAALWFVVQLHVACVAVAVFLQMHDGPRLNFSFSAYMYISLGNGTVYTCGNEIPQKQVYVVLHPGNSAVNSAFFRSLFQLFHSLIQRYPARLLQLVFRHF